MNKILVNEDELQAVENALCIVPRSQKNIRRAVSLVSEILNNSPRVSLYGDIVVEQQQITEHNQRVVEWDKTGWRIKT